MAPPIVIAHRGASAYRPEHTLASYELAIEMGADFIEPDLVATKDHRLVARHEPNITDTTDVADRAEFAARRTTKGIDGVERAGWFTDDFTLAELKTLRARERLPQIRSTALDGRFEIPTLAEVIALARRAGVGIYPETKHPTYFRSRGLALEEPLLDALDGWDLPVFIQSFEAGNLRELSRRTSVPLVQLMGAPLDLAEVAGYAAAVGPRKDLVDAALVRDAHDAGLLVHPYTFRPEPGFLPAGLDAAGELERFYRLGVDGVFADNPDIAVAVRRQVFG